MLGSDILTLVHLTKKFLSKPRKWIHSTSSLDKWISIRFICGSESIRMKLLTTELHRCKLECSGITATELGFREYVTLSEDNGDADRGSTDSKGYAQTAFKCSGG